MEYMEAQMDRLIEVGIQERDQLYQQVEELEKEIQRLKAAYEWQYLSKEKPKPGFSYLIWADHKGVPTYDVAFYEGTRPGGEHWWVLGDVSINQSSIIAWKYLITVEEFEQARRAK